MVTLRTFSLPGGRTLRRAVLVASLWALSSFGAYGQESAIGLRPQRHGVLPDGVEDLMVVDGELYCTSAGLLMHAIRSGEEVAVVLADTLYAKLNGKIDYLVTHPTTGDLYFTTHDKKGRPTLYCRHIETEESGKKKEKVSKVDLDGLPVEHPCFTDDGRIMVFSAKVKNRGRGGYDLWYSQYRNGKFEKPVGLGDRINTSADEVHPVLYRGFLIYASNGKEAEGRHYTLYATRLVANKVVGDTVGMLQIGRMPVQALPAPFNLAGHSILCLSVDTTNGCGYVALSPTAHKGAVIYSFSGMPTFRKVWGRVEDPSGKPVGGVEIRAEEHGEAVASAISNADGTYQLCLQHGHSYKIVCRKADFYEQQLRLESAPPSKERLITEERVDVALRGMAIGESIKLAHVFGPNADPELSPYGREQLDAVVRFLSDNPHLSISFSLSSDLTEDTHYNRLLTQSRLDALQQYLSGRLPQAVQATYRNACDGAEGCAGASGATVLEILISR